MIKKFLQYLNEKVGISSDGEILSDFLIKFLIKAEPGKKYLFVKNSKKEILMNFLSKNVIIVPGLPNLEKNVYKVYVDYSKTNIKAEAFFDPNRSRYTKNGYILYFTFVYRKERDNIWKHHIYHEVHHGIQFMEMGKKRIRNSTKYMKFRIMDNLKTSPVYKKFLHMLYQTINIEKGAFIAQFYGKLKYRKNIKSVEDLKKYFKKRNTYEYMVAYELAYFDINNLFKLKFINPETGKAEAITNREEMRRFFTLFKKLGKDINDYKDVDEFIKNIKHLNKKMAIEFDNKHLISDKELDATINRYTKYFNEEGKKLIKKLDKTYSLLIDYYTDKFENQENFLNEAYYVDLTPHEYSHHRGYPRVVNVGWLDKGQLFEEGDVPESFIRRLKQSEIVHNHKGSHCCPFCNNSRSNKIIAVEGRGKTYFAPFMIFHYIEEHHYKPPQEFIEAVMEYPDKENPKIRYYKRKDDLSWG